MPECFEMINVGRGVELVMTLTGIDGGFQPEFKYRWTQNLNISRLFFFLWSTNPMKRPSPRMC